MKVKESNEFTIEGLIAEEFGAVVYKYAVESKTTHGIVVQFFLMAFKDGARLMSVESRLSQKTMVLEESNCAALNMHPASSKEAIQIVFDEIVFNHVLIHFNNLKISWRKP